MLPSITTATFYFIIQTFLVNYSMPKIFQWGKKLSNLIPNYQKRFPLPTTIFWFNKLPGRVWPESTIECWEREHKRALRAFVSIACLPAEFKTTFRPWICTPWQNTDRFSCWIGISDILTNTSDGGLHEPVAMAGHQKNSNNMFGVLPFFHAWGNAICHSVWLSTGWHNYNSTASILFGSSNIWVP